MNELSLFTGIGGGVYGGKLLGWRTVGYVERDDYCQRVIRARIDDGTFDDAPIFGDIDSFIDEGYADSYANMVDVLSAGYPCQAFSSAARGRNVESDLWPKVRTCVFRIRPLYVLLENVAGARGSLVAAASDLAFLGYHVHGPEPMQAADVGAPYPGGRLWVVATTDRNRKSTLAEYGEMAIVQTPPTAIWKDVERGDLGMADGDAHRGKRLKAVGNAQIPVMAASAWVRGMMELSNELCARIERRR